MKWISAALLPLVIGYFSGRQIHHRSMNESPTSQSQPMAITFLGGSGSALSSRRPRGIYSNQELVDLSIQAQREDDYDLLVAIYREWALAEDGTGIDALIAAGESDTAYRILAEWSQLEPLAAAAKASAMVAETSKQRRTKETVLNRGIVEVLKTNPEHLRAIDWATEVSGEFFDSFYADSLQDLNPSQIEDALNALELLSNRFLREQYAGPFLERWAESQPEKALDWVEENLAVTNRANYRKKVFDKFVASDPEKALRFFESILDDPARAGACVSSLIANMSQSDPDTLTKLFRSQSPETLKQLKPFVDYGYYDSARLSWNGLAEELGPGHEWMLIPENENFVEVEWPISDLVEARAFMTRELERASMNGEAHLEWSPETINQAVVVLKNAGEFAAPAAYAIAEKWASFDPRTAFEWAAGLDPELRIGASEAALGAWFENEPGKAVDYVDSLPDSEFRRYAVERVTKDWLQTSPETAVRWINKMPLGIDRDIGKREIANTFLQRNPNRAFLNANAIGHPVMRDEALENVFAVWFGKDPEAAAESLSHANIPPQRRAEIGGGH